MELKCKHCNSIINLDFKGTPEYFVCPECHHIFRLNTKEELISKNQFTGSSNYKSIPLGEKGTINGIEYTITGVLLKQALKSSKWFEYVLQDKDKQFIYLSEYDGHWTLFKEFTEVLPPWSKGNQIIYKNETFKLYDRLSVNTISAKGIFDFEITPHKIDVCELICVPKMISIEKLGVVETVFLGEHIDRESIQKAFPNITLPQKKGVGIVEPYRIDFKWFAKSYLFTFLLILITQFFLVSTSAKQNVLDQTLLFTDYNNKEFISPSFTLTGRIAPLRVIARTDVDNSWANVDISLVNEKTNETIFAGRDIEYYHGYSGGESWSEGSREVNIDLCGVSAGQYHLTIYAQKAPEDLINNQLVLKAIWGDVSYWNFWMITIFMLVVYSIVYLFNLNHNVKRWSDSSFSPYITKQ